jgi:hypothetical protein
MAMRAEKAAVKTTVRGCRMAMSAATKKVLSPISENIIMVKDRTNEWNGCITPLGSSSESGIVFGGDVSSGSSLSEEGGTGWGISCGESGRSVGFYTFVNERT